MKKLVLQLITLFAIASMAMPFAKAYAVVGSGQAHLSLSTASSYVEGSTAYVTVRETSSVAVAGVEAGFSYDPTQLQYITTDTSSSAFNTYQPSTGGGGSVYIARTEQGGTFPVGSATIAVVSFKVLASSGTANLAVLSSSDIDDSVSASSLCDASCAGGNVADSFQMTAPVQTQPSNTNPNSNTTANSKSRPSSAPTSSSSSASSTTSSTPTTNSNTTVKTTTGATKSSTSPITVRNAATHTSATAAHLGLWGSFVAILLLIAAAYWFVFRKYKYTFNVSAVAKSTASAPTKSKQTTAKKKQAKPSKTK